MPVTVVIGGQYGSEGKGKVAYHFTQKYGAKIAIRVGGSNSGHTVIGSDDKPIIFKQLPTGSIIPGVTSVISAGSYIQPDILLQEIYREKVDGRNVCIDPFAVIIDDHCRRQEIGLSDEIGSTQSGTGAALVARLRRDGSVRFAKDDPRLETFIRPTKKILRNALSAKDNVIIEGTQGYGLSVLHSHHYPFVTSRDTTASGFLSEAGLSPLDVENVVMVIRAFPIRVAGNSGPLKNEITWEALRNSSGAKSDLTERTSVTKKIRRVGTFDPEIVNLAIEVNQPNHIVLNHVDYVDRSIFNKKFLSQKATRFISDINNSIDRNIDSIGTGPGIVLSNEVVALNRPEVA